MTIAQARNFYAQDKKKYELQNNREFLTWLDILIKQGYSVPLDIEQMQELINNIATWYEMKYPERELEKSHGTEYINFSDIESISDVMDIRQLYFRLPHDQLCLMECGYRAKGWGMHAVYENGEAKGFRTDIFMPIYINNPDSPYNESHFLLRADSETGIVDCDCCVKKYYDGKDNISLDQLLEIFQNNQGSALDSRELEECVLNHNCDLELRNALLKLVAVKLLFSRNTIPERGYERAKKFIEEFRQEPGVELHKGEIDSIMRTKYPNEPVSNAKGIKRVLVKVLNK